MEELLKIEGLKVHFPVKGGGVVYAVDGVNLTIFKGETLGLVGESGCGKSTLGKSILRLVEPTSGEIFFKSENIRSLGTKELQAKRKEMQMVFQDPFSSLNPRMRIEEIVGEPLDIHSLSRSGRRERVIELLESVGLGEDAMPRFPHQFSGGQRQRIGLARALAVEPEFIVADEPVSALDVSIQAQIVNLMKDLGETFSLTYLFIAHDLRVVEYISDRVAIMYLGKIVEIGLSKEIYSLPRHPYTKALFSSIPEPSPGAKGSKTLLKGDMPSPLMPPSGCSFHTRCPIAEPLCRKELPVLREIGEKHSVACHLA
ncbi:MAG: ATP-binding cassette domain-containing protein [Proteobacteria bacterium]|nr:ATP-binding cassette domain-containing protein [Pseudomonadota bacterium]